MILRTLIVMLCLAGLQQGAAQAQSQAQAQTEAPVLVTGTVADEATRAALLERLRGVYGAARVVDQLAVGIVSTPANWNTYVGRLIGPNLRLVKGGQLHIDGNSVSLRGDVASEEQRQKIAGDIAASLNPTYTVNNGLRVSAAEQRLLDAALDRRIIEFDSGQASITPAGMAILDEMAAAMQKLKGRMVEVIGHTDNTGLRASNISLSQARAEAVRSYLATKGIAPETVLTSGQGPDRPVASNTTVDGRARNRRIEFRIAQ